MATRDPSTPNEWTTPQRLQPAPVRVTEDAAPGFVPAGLVTINQYLALRQVPEHRRAARRAFAGEVRFASIEDFDRLFAGIGGRRS